MFTHTHLAMGLYLFLMVDRLVVVESQVVLLGIVLAGSVLPDIDITTSFLGKRLKVIGNVLKHRGITHTIFGLALFTILVHAIWTSYIYTAAFLLAYFFHLFLDSFNKKGIKPFWFGLHVKGFVKTGLLVDHFLFLFLLFVSLLMMFGVV